MINKSGFLNIIDDNGNVTRIYPETKIANVEDLSNTLSSKANLNHTQSSNTINSMTGYSKSSEVSDVSSSDTLNTAIGKIEKKCDVLSEMTESCVKSISVGSNVYEPENGNVRLPEYSDLNTDNLSQCAIAGFFNTTTNNTTDFYLTLDGKTFKRISESSGIVQTDGDMIFVGDTFYYACKSYDGVHTLRILTSKNLINWETRFFTFVEIPNSSNVGYGEKWLVDGDKIYLIYGQIVSETPDRQVRPYIVECTDIANLQFGAARELLPYGYRIDPMIIKKDNEYFLFCKKEKTDSTNRYGDIETWKSTDLLTWINVTYSISALSDYQYEGPFVNFQNNKYYLYVDNWGATHFYGIEVCESTDLINWTKPVRAITDKISRHGFCRTITNVKENNIINNYIEAQNTLKDEKSVFYIHSQSDDNKNVYTKLFEFELIGDSTFLVEFTVTDIQVGYYDSDFVLSITNITSGSPTRRILFEEVAHRQQSLVDAPEIKLRYTIEGDKVTVLIQNDKMWATPCLTIGRMTRRPINNVKIFRDNISVNYSDSFLAPTKKRDVSSSVELAYSENIAGGTIRYTIIDDSILAITFTNIQLAEPLTEKFRYTYIGDFYKLNVVDTVYATVTGMYTGRSYVMKFHNDQDNNIAIEIGGGELGIDTSELISGTCIVPFVYVP
jgi:hypothetical protein